MKPLIRFTIHNIIDVNSTGELRKNIFNDSYEEFNMQAQAYNAGTKLKTLSEITAANPKAESLHYKVGFAVALYIKQIENKTLEGIAGLSAPLRFEKYQFRILDSDTTTPNHHRVRISYLTVPYTLLNNIGSRLIVAEGDHSNSLSCEWLDTIQVKPDDLSIFVSAYSG